MRELVEMKPWERLALLYLAVTYQDSRPK